MIHNSVDLESDLVVEGEKHQQCSSSRSVVNDLGDGEQIFETDEHCEFICVSPLETTSSSALTRSRSLFPTWQQIYHTSDRARVVFPPSMGKRERMQVE